MTTYTNQKDHGANGKNFEVAVRLAITPKTKATYCKSMRMTDHRIKVNGEWKNIEIKLGAGTLDYNRNGTLDLTIPATDHIPHLYEKADFVIYAPNWDGSDVLENAWVFTRTDFLTMLTDYAGMVKYNRKSDTTTINIQTFSNSKPRLTHIWNATLDQPNLGEWLSEIR